MKKLGIEPKVVLFEDTATAPEIASTLTSAGAAKAGAISFNPSSNAQCNLLYDSLKQLGIEFDSPRHHLARVPGHPSILGTANGRPQPSDPR